MEVRSAEPLAPHTTLRIGGPAARYAVAESEKDVHTALGAAREEGLPLRVLGGGSNVLIPDEGVHAFVLRVNIRGVEFFDEGACARCVAGAGEPWNAVVDAACARGLWGLENLAGIPGTVGGAVVQNIGAYGAELSETFLSADVVDTSGGVRRVNARGASFAYRGSIFKNNASLSITRATLVLPKNGTPRLSYGDLARAHAAGAALSHPSEVARAIRAIRSRKFPGPLEEGTAGSFFKNPAVTVREASALAARYPGLPRYPQEDGNVKLSLAWLLDHALSLKGFSHGRARLYEKQPLVVVVRDGAAAGEVDALAREVESRVRNELGLIIEREVETFT